MKLYFSKNGQNEIVVQMSSSTIQEDFSYIEMIKNLLIRNEFEETEYIGDFTDDEKGRIETMLKEINDSIISSVEESEETAENIEDTE